MNIYETLQNTAKDFPERVAIHDDYGSLTYKALFDQTEKLKAHLIASGVASNTGVALITKNSRYFIIGLYAGVGCGAVVMPISPQQRPQEIQSALSEAQLHFILTDDETFNSHGNKSETITILPNDLFLTTTGRDSNDLTVPFIQDVAFMRFTSGTTGSAKCVILSHRSVIERIEAANEELKITADDNVVWVLPMAYHFIVSIVLYIRYGAGIIVCNDFLAEHLLGKIQNHRGTFFYGSPMHIRLLAASTDRVSLPSLRCVISTTTAVNPEHCKTFREKYKLAVHQAFGIIEIGLPIINMLDAEDHPEAVGKCLSGYEVAILDNDLNPLPSGTSGLLAIKGPGMFDGYLSPPTMRSDVLKNGWFVTGDYASLSPDGIIEIKGREKSMINVSGNKVFPDEVEAVINSFPGISESKVTGISHPLFGEVVIAEVMLKPNSDLNEEELIQYCRKSLSAFKVPQKISVVDKIEMTDSGKIKRK